MKPIDFDRHYAQYAERWLLENKKPDQTFDQLEALLPEIYLRWLNCKADFLDGLTPAEYFARITDLRDLLQMLSDYVAQDVDVPDLLLERIVDMGEACVAPLMEWASNPREREELRLIALNLLIEMGSSEPLSLCLDLIDARARHDDVADVAAELLEGLGLRAVQQMLDRLSQASDEAMVTYLDLLSNHPGDPRIYECAVAQFYRQEDRRALLASYLGKIGDERAIQPLRRALELDDINYLDYIEIRNAIERLGGEIDGPERNFDGDPYYESLRRTQ